MTDPTPARPRVLIVDDDQELVRLLEAILKRLDVEIAIASTGRRAIQAILDAPPELVLLDMRLPDIDGLEVLEYLGDSGIMAPVVVMTADTSVDLAVEAMRLGAFDYLTKPLDGQRLRSVVRNALRRQSFLATLEQEEEPGALRRFHGLLGGAPAMQRLYRLIRQSAGGTAPVLIFGEEGTELELTARALVAQSDRAEAPIALLNATRTSPETAPEQLFGAVRAADGVPSLFRQAEAGTLLLLNAERLGNETLDLVADFIRTGFVPGERDDDAPLDVRIVATLQLRAGLLPADAGLSGEFVRQASQHLVAVPPLRDRGEDILELGMYYLRLYGSEHGKRFAGLSNEAQSALLYYSWPGNVDELRDKMRWVADHHAGGSVGGSAFGEYATGDRPARARATPIDQAARKLVEPMWKLEKEAIERALKLCDGSVVDAARLLEISPALLYRKIRRIETMDR